MGKLSLARRGFTLIELLAVFAVIGILVALLLPAIQHARESARRTQCKSNLHQIGIALHSYQSLQGVLPPGCVGLDGDPVNIQGWGWGVMLLPYLDQQPLYDTLQPNHHSLADVLADPNLQPYLLTPLPIYRCASDLGDGIQSTERTLSGFILTSQPSQTLALRYPSKDQLVILALQSSLACVMPPPPPWNPPPPSAPPPPPGTWGVRAATSNYIGSFGDFWQTDSNAWSSADFAGNGLFGSNSNVGSSGIPDGASQTFAVGERGWNAYGSIWAGTDGWDRCEREGIPMVMGTAFYKMNSTPDPYNLSCDPKGAAGYGSMHAGGAHFLMADGAVRFVSEQINFANSNDPTQLGVYQKLARRNDGQTIGDF
ncbi:MAG: hypothetical protein JWM11_6670 [Planctomycetaceae bacterium]|nr:hypothetical protein [Planctomycetaceae bacterium]